MVAPLAHDCLACACEHTIVGALRVTARPRNTVVLALQHALLKELRVLVLRPELNLPSLSISCVGSGYKLGLADVSVQIIFRVLVVGALALLLVHARAHAAVQKALVIVELVEVVAARVAFIALEVTAASLLGIEVLVSGGASLIKGIFFYG